MKYEVRYSDEALEDLERLYDYLITWDPDAAEKSYAVLQRAINLLEDFPFSCRKAAGDSSFLRELVVPFGSTGYVALFEIEEDHKVTILAIRHQREEDYH
ncbi:plasmid stabilization system protein ParE [Rhizobium sp. BK275]|uniref:type II toxin-antitoxin system RelE/ParE family toxin n=1 Tax=unclassified Rhizobium TaxID=2613769 RepID=UPI0016215C7A|nr:plasmid stabilization system protein ParE [Rhizobium sp. BK275]MBB3408764.1 plasmid stabilization system protein ParE [Rhizobium sp. BK316]